MSSTQDSTLAQHKEDALRDLQALLHPNADTCEAALRELANKWWTIFQEKGNNYSHFRHHAGAIYRYTLEYMITHIDPTEGGDSYRRNFQRFTHVFMRNVPRDYWTMFFLEWHDFQAAYLQGTYLSSAKSSLESIMLTGDIAELESNPCLDKGEVKKKAEALKELQAVLKDDE